jgi:hypothetical protein
MEPAPSLRLMLPAFLVFGIGIYVFFAALMLETYVLLPVAVVCFLAAFAPALKLVRQR